MIATAENGRAPAASAKGGQAPGLVEGRTLANARGGSMVTGAYDNNKTLVLQGLGKKSFPPRGE
jgi:hypothetical protein